MLWVNVKRIFKTGFVQFWRNGMVSLSAVLVMITTLFVIGSVIFTNAFLTNFSIALKKKVDVNVYFVPSAFESEILDVKKSIESLPEVEYVEYLSREQVLENFKERHKNDERRLEGLLELNDNPFGATLNIKAKEPSQYEGIANFLEQNYPTDVTDENGIVEAINYTDNKKSIDTLGQIIDSAERLGIILSIIFIAISIIIALNTVRLTMYISRDEIGVMKLVGANRRYISGPFIIIGAMYGVVSAILTLIIFWPITFWIGPITEKLFLDINIFEYYIYSFWEMFLIIFVSGIFIGAFSSFLAINRYLRIR
jgi:cell division transport system permease protein